MDTGALEAMVETNAGPVRFFSLHLSPPIAARVSKAWVDSEAQGSDHQPYWVEMRVRNAKRSRLSEAPTDGSGKCRASGDSSVQRPGLDKGPGRE